MHSLGKSRRPARQFILTVSRIAGTPWRSGATLDIAEDGVDIASWPYDDLRMVDGGPGTLRLKSVSTLPLARLEVFDPAAQRQITEHARFLKGEGGGPAHTGRIVAWSLAAVVSIFVVVVYGMPLAADRLTPLIPLSFDRHLSADR